MFSTELRSFSPANGETPVRLITDTTLRFNDNPMGRPENIYYTLNLTHHRYAITPIGLGKERGVLEKSDVFAKS